MLKYVNQVVPDNLYDMLKIDFLTQRKDEQFALVCSELNNKLVQTSESERVVDANVQDSMFTLR